MCPIYEYACSGKCPQWESIQKIWEPHIKKCPTCKKNMAKRLISGGGFILKGEGFYKQEVNNDHFDD